MALICGLVVFGLLLAVADPVVIRVENLPERCDYSKCARWDPNQINVHLVSHTHDDVGWLKTVDQYYYGLHNEIQNAGVQYILDSVVEELIRNKERRFIYVESAFWWKWWQEQDTEMRSVVTELVRTGQLEFVNGGWSMPDEATTHYNSLIDQSSWGLRRLNDTFGRCGVPRVTWQIDPFGHSRELASLFAQMNYDAMFFARQDYQDCENRRKHRTLEHVWQGSDDLGAAGDLFTGMMYTGYGPIGFNWEVEAGSAFQDAVVDNPESEEYNVPRVVEHLVDWAHRFAEVYATRNVMFPMGTDFYYQDAHIWFKNLDKLIRAVNKAGRGVRVFYSTPSCYAKALHESNRTWTGKRDDYFPYASAEHDYWTGYFTSRPAIKRMERIGNNLLQACKQLDVLADNGARFEPNITRLREAMGVMQHHDAVSGTEKQHVAFNYAKMLDAAMDGCRQVVAASLDKLQQPGHGHLQTAPPVRHFCPYLNISSCPATESGSPVAIALYNPLAHPVNRTIRVPVQDGLYYRVLSDRSSVPAVLVPIAEYVQRIPGRTSHATMELVFRATNIPPLGVSVYQVIPGERPNPDSAPVLAGKPIREPTTLRFRDTAITFDAAGRLVELMRHGHRIQLNQSFQYYESMLGEGKNSGAYVFRPKEQHTVPLTGLRPIHSMLYADQKHQLVLEVQQRFAGAFVNQTIRLEPSTEHLEFDFVVGPIPVDTDWTGKEVVARYTTDLDSQGVFYTDANGRQMIRRQWNHRDQWNYKMNEPIAGNYYPVNSRIAVRDQHRQLQMTILVDRSQGGSILPNRTVDLMIHRRTLGDDDKGVNEPLNEPGVDGRGLVIRGRHLLLLDELSTAASRHRPLAQQLFMEPIISFAAPTAVTTNTIEPGLAAGGLPENVHLLTLEAWRDQGYLLRLEHFYQKDEDEKLSRPVTVSLSGLFSAFEIVEVRELTLSANADVQALKHRLVFDYEPVSNRTGGPLASPPVSEPNFEVRLQPMQIRTFWVRVNRHASQNC